MGYYIEVERNRDKASQILEKFPQAKRITQAEAEEQVMDPTVGVICVVMNPLFDAAGFVYDQKEFRAFTQPGDTRPRQWLTMPRTEAEQASNYRGRG